jgi:hypothetical protein
MNYSLFIRILIGYAVAVSSFVEAEPLRSTIASVDTLWKDKPNECCEYVWKIANAMNLRSASRPIPDETVVLSKNELQHLLTHVCSLPVQPNLEDSCNRLRKKWRMIWELSQYVPDLTTSAKTWLEVATGIGEMRGQCIPGYVHPPESRWVFNWRKTKAENQASREAYRKKDLESWYQSALLLICDNLKGEIKAIRTFAASLPPDERKQFLDKIKELARSDDEEAKLLDEPIVPKKVPYPPVADMREFLSHMSPDKRKQTIEAIKQESDYTKEQIKLIEAPFE